MTVVASDKVVEAGFWLVIYTHIQKILADVLPDKENTIIPDVG